MVDIETLDTEQSAVILSIGACRFIGSDRFYEELDYKDQPGRTISPETLDFWLTIGNAPVKGKVKLKEALVKFKSFLPPNPVIWCKGTDFDTMILANAYKGAGLLVPWKYNATRDMRTLLKEFPILEDSVPPNLNPHNALMDALYQASQVTEIFKRYRDGSN